MARSTIDEGTLKAESVRNQDRDGTLVLSRCPCTITEIRQQLRQADIQIHQESVSGRSLEDYFLALTGGEGT